jgi:hypothetical protein
MQVEKTTVIITMLCASLVSFVFRDLFNTKAQRSSQRAQRKSCLVSRDFLVNDESFVNERQARQSRTLVLAFEKKYALFTSDERRGTAENLKLLLVGETD